MTGRLTTEWSRRASERDARGSFGIVIRTKNEDIGSVGIGVVCSGAVFIAARRFFDGSCESQQPSSFARSDLRHATKTKHINVWLLPTLGLVGQVVAFIAASGSLGQRRVVGANPPGIVPSFRSHRGAVRASPLVSSAGRVVVVSGVGGFVTSAPLLRVTWIVMALSCLLTWRGLIRGAV